MDAERQPEIGRDERAHSAKSIRGDADYGVRLPIDLEIAADEIVAASHPLPKCVTGDHHRYVRVRTAFLRGIKAAAHRLHAHKREEIFRSQKGKTPPHLVIATDSGDAELKRGKIDKQIAAILAQIALFGMRELPVIVVRVLACCENAYHFLGSQWNHRPQHHAIDEGENG
jgi:hypothetical protein